MKPGSQRRAQRFPVHVPVRYRSVGATAWSEGRIENISRSGVLFWTDQLPALETPLELLFVLPVGARAPGISCRGRIVRTLPPVGPQGLRIAATFSSYRFVRGRAITA